MLYIVIGLMAYDIVLTIVCAKLFSTVHESNVKSENVSRMVGDYHSCMTCIHGNLSEDKFPCDVCHSWSMYVKGEPNDR